MADTRKKWIDDKVSIAENLAKALKRYQEYIPGQPGAGDYTDKTLQASIHIVHLESIAAWLKTLK